MCLKQMLLLSLNFPFLCNKVTQQHFQTPFLINIFIQTQLYIYNILISLEYPLGRLLAYIFLPPVDVKITYLLSILDFKLNLIKIKKNSCSVEISFHNSKLRKCNLRKYYCAALRLLLEDFRQMCSVFMLILIDKSSISVWTIDFIFLLHLSLHFS